MSDPVPQNGEAEEKVDGQTATEPTAPDAESRPPATEAAEKPDPPRDDSLSASDGKDPGAVPDPVPQNGEAEETVDGQTASQPTAPDAESRPPATEAAEKPDPPRDGSLSASDGKDPGAVPDPVPQNGEAEEKVDGQTATEPTAPDAEGRPPATETAEKPDPPGDDSLSASDGKDPGAVPDPVPQNGEAEEKVDGQTASQPTGPDADSRPPATEAAEKPDPPRDDSLSASDGKDPGAVPDPVPQNGEADVDSGSVPADSTSGEDTAPAASPAAEAAAGAAAESSHRNGETVSESPVDDGTPPPAEAAPTETETQQATRDLEQSRRQTIFSAIVHRGGTAAYANSEAARKEFPRLDLGVRGAISIARRMQDPLAELAKIQPKAVVAGPEPFEVDQKRLKRTLNGTVDSCINQVGVDVNTAPVEMLAHVAGLNTSLARSIVEYRRQHGHFTSRSQLMEVPGLTDTSFEQAAGFLRVPESTQPLDRTAIHPECYGLVEAMAGSVQATVAELMESPEKLKALDLEKLSDDRFGMPTLQDIRQELGRRGRDRRKAFVPPSFRADVKELSDLQKGMLVEGTVSNVTSFGAFVDIGVQQEGLVHISELSSRFVQDANQAVHVGQVVKVKVIGVDAATNRISLSIKALRIRENSRKRKKKKPSKAAPRALSPKPKEASTRESGNHQEKQRSGKPDRKPVGRRGRQGKKRQATAVKPAAIQRNRPKTPVAEVLPDTSNLSFSEKIRLLQEKFGGVR